MEQSRLRHSKVSNEEEEEEEEEKALYSGSFVIQSTYFCPIPPQNCRELRHSNTYTSSIPCTVKALDNALF